jgi:predicted nuclease of predicted toxin-antitoxin system
LAKFIEQCGFEAIHVNTILDKWHSKDSDIANYADLNNLIIITKDIDFRDSFFIRKSPKKLIKINLGNISNKDLIILFETLLKKMEGLNTDIPFLLEVDKDYINYHTL